MMSFLAALMAGTWLPRRSAIQTVNYCLFCLRTPLCPLETTAILPLVPRKARQITGGFDPSDPLLAGLSEPVDSFSIFVTVETTNAATCFGSQIASALDLRRATAVWRGRVVSDHRAPLRRPR